MRYNRQTEGIPEGGFFLCLIEAQENIMLKFSQIEVFL